METKELPETSSNVPEQIIPSSLVERFARTNRLFLLTVVLPVLLSAFYYGMLASDIYISESRFIIRSPQRQTTTGLSAILQGAGFSRSQDDTYTVQDFMLSRDALHQINLQLKLAESWGSSKLDRFSRFAGLDMDNSFEALHRYYQKRITISQDSASSIATLRVSAFGPDEAQRINILLLDMSEKLINQLNERGRQDMIRFAEAEATQAEARAKTATLAVSSYRNKKGIFDPERQSALQLQQVSKLQDELIATRTQFDQIRSLTKNNPQVSVLQRRIETLQREIDSEMGKVTGNSTSLTSKAADYERLMLEQTFSEKQLAVALASLEQARNEAQRKQLYLERIVMPNKPDVAVQPRRMRSVLVTFGVGMILWGVLSLLLAGVREHHD